jgi:hypothetical protein
MKTLTLEGDIASADSLTRLTTQGSVTAPSLVTPADVSRIQTIIVAASTEGLADGAQSYFVRIGGNAVRNGEQVIAISAVGRIAPQSGSDSAPQLMAPFVLENVDIEIGPSDTVTISVEGAGTDTGTGHAVVTLVFA